MDELYPESVELGLDTSLQTVGILPGTRGEALDNFLLILKVVEKLAQKSSLIKILGSISDEKLFSLYRSCKALVFPVEQEDFGIVPVEAQGFGKPVVALRSGGAKETVLDKKTD